MSQPRRELSLFDCTAMIVGIIIGAGLYEATPRIAGVVGSVGELIAVWVAGGVFALVGAMCYAELATSMPHEGGDYVFLSRGLGRGVGFLFAWVQLWVVRPGSIGAMAYVFGSYATQLAPLGTWSATIYAIGGVAVLTAINSLGVRPGKWTQGILTTAKVVGLISVILLGFFASGNNPTTVEQHQPNGFYAVAMIMVLFAYSGWNEMVYVAAEVKDPRRNIVLALIGGTLAVAAIYVAVNLAMVFALGLSGVATSGAVAAEVVERAVGAWGGKAVSLLICTSALGAMNGMTFTGSRVYYAMGRDHRLFAPLGRWHPRLGTPVNSLVTEAAITAAMMVTLAVIYGPERQHFDKLLMFTAPLFWVFLGLAGVSLLVLRQRQAIAADAFLTPLYPATPLVFIAVCGFMTWSSTTYAISNRSIEAVWSLAMLVIGCIVAAVESRRGGNDVSS